MPHSDAPPAALGGALPRRWLLPAGLGAFALALGLYVIYMVIHPKSFTMDPVDLAVYRSGGLIVRHVRPLYDPRLAAPLYDWVGYGKLHLPFTYTPFAAIVFAVISFVPWWLSQQLSVAVDILALLTALWLTLGGLGYRKDKTRLAITLLGAAAVFWTEPVLRTMYLGQVNLVLMTLIIWDLCQPDTENSRWWKGFGTGIAAGIKLVPLVFPVEGVTVYATCEFMNPSGSIKDRFACAVIATTGARLLGPALREILDTAPRGEISESIRRAARSVPGVIDLDKCFVRKMGVSYYVDLHVLVDGSISVHKGHELAHRVKDAIRATNPRIADVLVHIEPANPQR